MCTNFNFNIKGHLTKGTQNVCVQLYIQRPVDELTFPRF